MYVPVHIDSYLSTLYNVYEFKKNQFELFICIVTRIVWECSTKSCFTLSVETAFILEQMEKLLDSQYRMIKLIGIPHIPYTIQ